MLIVDSLRGRIVASLLKLLLQMAVVGKCGYESAARLLSPRQLLLILAIECLSIVRRLLRGRAAL
ncbi:hypothetical protein WK47_24760 [Burkholderia ubonensis]|nr:hypothetical protein WJ74_11070 [Burkholderia ubonensis]KVT01090.1 hypothetical protein WK47_24760 [Burkholderia ubonensis]KVT07476.1 hypothetical protein WK46_11135 [Burkholderia ubonensis]KVT33746.1 hypothetical protein WK50_02145 [Burkholderia ubonensis]